MQRLAEIKGLSEAKVEKMVEAAKKMCTLCGWHTAKIVDELVCSVIMLPRQHTAYCNTMNAWQSILLQLSCFLTQIIDRQLCLCLLSVCSVSKR